VQNGVVTLGGTVYGPPDKDSALSLVANTPGVKDVVDNLEVAPFRRWTTGCGCELARAIYGDAAAEKYALDPAKPIRITVVNGNVTLSGVVDSKMDTTSRDVRANGVPGVFKVTTICRLPGRSRGNRGWRSAVRIKKRNAGIRSSHAALRR
jgi:hyperosmotically inducible protein